MLSAVEGLEVVSPALQALGDPADAGHPVRACSRCRSAAPAASAVLRPGHAGVVPRDRGAGRFAHRRPPGDPAGAQPAPRAAVHARHNPGTTFIILGAVVLCVTGAEALYADLGHFGKKPIRLAWFSVVMPALTLNYFGQGALLLARPEAVKNPFYLMAPGLGAGCRWCIWRPRPR